MSLRTVIVMVAVCWATAAASKDRPVREDGGGGALEPLMACRSLTTDQAKLSCYEMAAATLDQQIRDKRVRVVNQRDIRDAKRSLFGFTLPRIDLFGNESKEDELSELNTTIVSAAPLPNERLQLQVAEGGAVWSTTEPVGFVPQTGTKVRIRKGPMGSYFIAITGARSVRGMRVR